MTKTDSETRVATYHYVLRLLSDENYECLNYEALDGLISGQKNNEDFGPAEDLLSYTVKGFNHISHEFSKLVATATSFTGTRAQFIFSILLYNLHTVALRKPSCTR